MQILCAQCNRKIRCYVLDHAIKCETIPCYLKQIITLGCKVSDDARLSTLCENHMNEYDERVEVHKAYVLHLGLLKEFTIDVEPPFPSSTKTVYVEENLLPIAEIFEMGEVLKIILLSSGIQEGYYDITTGMFVVRSEHNLGANILLGISPNLEEWETIDFE